MKILILNDSHDRGRNSIHRLGNMHSDFLLKLDETIEISKDCDFVVHLGDIWDSPIVSNTIIDEWLDRIELSKKKWYILPGNHDMIGASWQTSKNTALAHAFRRSNNIEFLSEIDFPKEKLFIKGYPYYFGCENDIANEGLKHDKKGYYTIACTHAFISIKPFLTNVIHVQAKDIKTNYNTVFCSHFHTVFDKLFNKTRYFNLGAWGRLSITEVKHTPQIGIFDSSTKEIEIIKLKSAKKGEDIFDLTKLDEIKENDETLDEFLKSLESTVFQGENIKEKIISIGKELNSDKESIDLLLEKIDKLEIKND